MDVYIKLSKYWFSTTLDGKSYLPKQFYFIFMKINKLYFV